MKEKIKKGVVTIKKYDQQYEFKNNVLFLKRSKPLQGAEFEITAAQDIKDNDNHLIYTAGELVAHSIITNADGEAVIKGMKYGIYNIYETNRISDMHCIHKGYISRFELNQEEIEIELDSKLILGTLKIQNRSPNDIPFTILDKNKSVILRNTAEQDSNIIFDEMMPVGTYYYKDTENNITVFEIRNNAEITMIEVTEENTIIKTIHKNCNENEIILYKTDEQGNPLAGAVFGLIDMYGDKTSFACSNIDGRVIFKHLEKGTYIVREIEAPYGYSKSSSNIIFTINENWINQEERIKNGENFNEVYIVVADSRYEQTQNIIDSEPEMIIEYEKFTEMNRIL